MAEPLESEAPPVGEELHLPGPSLIPVINATGVALSLVGLTTMLILPGSGSRCSSSRSCSGCATRGGSSTSFRWIIPRGTSSVGRRGGRRRLTTH